MCLLKEGMVSNFVHFRFHYAISLKKIMNSAVSRCVLVPFERILQ